MLEYVVELPEEAVDGDVVTFEGTVESSGCQWSVGGEETATVVEDIFQRVLLSVVQLLPRTSRSLSSVTISLPKKSHVFVVLGSKGTESGSITRLRRFSSRSRITPLVGKEFSCCSSECR